MHGEPQSKLHATNHVEIGDTAALRSLASKLGTTVEHLRELIARVGTRVSDLEAELDRPDSLD